MSFKVKRFDEEIFISGYNTTESINSVIYILETYVENKEEFLKLKNLIENNYNCKPNSLTILSNRLIRKYSVKDRDYEENYIEFIEKSLEEITNLQDKIVKRTREYLESPDGNRNIYYSKSIDKKLDNIVFNAMNVQGLFNYKSKEYKKI